MPINIDKKEIVIHLLHSNKEIIMLKHCLGQTIRKKNKNV